MYTLHNLHDFIYNRIEQKLEQTINKLRSELQEVKRESKHKIDAFTIIERNTKNELKKLKEEHDTLNNKSVFLLKSY